MWRIRSILFNILFYSLSFILLTTGLPLLLAPRSWLRRVPPVWLWIGYQLEKHVLGLDYRVIGKENLPPAPYLVAMKHQSAWETMKLYALFTNPAIVLKKELMDAMILGSYGRAMDMVPVDRSKGRETMKYLVEAAQTIIPEKRPLVIFPQGTRVAPEAKEAYKAGIIRLYEGLNIPLVPVALNSGLFWGRNAFWKRGGLITVEILPVIPAGLPKGEVFAKLEEQIESRSDALARQAVKEFKLEREFPLLAEKA